MNKSILTLIFASFLLNGCSDVNQYSEEKDKTKELMDYIESIDPETTTKDICDDKIKQIISIDPNDSLTKTYFFKDSIIVEEANKMSLTDGESYRVKGQSKGVGKMLFTINIRQYTALERFNGKKDLIKEFSNLTIGKKINIECRFVTILGSVSDGCSFNKGYRAGVKLELKGETCNIN